MFCGDISPNEVVNEFFGRDVVEGSTRQVIHDRVHEGDAEKAFNWLNEEYTFLTLAGSNVDAAQEVAAALTAKVAERKTSLEVYDPYKLWCAVQSAARLYPAGSVDEACRLMALGTEVMVINHLPQRVGQALITNMLEMVMLERLNNDLPTLLIVSGSANDFVNKFRSVRRRPMQRVIEGSQSVVCRIRDASDDH